MDIFVGMRMLKVRHLLFSILFLQGSLLFAQEETADYFGRKPFVYDDETYENAIKTVTLHPFNDPMGLPLFSLKEPENKLQLGFDIMNSGDQNFYYTLIHCSWDWKPSSLLPSQYIDGFYDEQIFGISFSMGTIKNYAHYELLFPSESMRINKTGNYLIKVYREGEPDKPVLSKRFMVVEERIWIFAKVNQSNVVSERWEKQELSFELDYSSLRVTNPTSELRCVVLKNRNWNSMVTDLEPYSMLDKHLVFDFNEKLRFYGGKEFRYFNTNSITFKSEWVEDIFTDSSGSHFILKTLAPASKTKYLEYEDLNGRFMVDKAYSKRSEIEADYVYVTFTLSTPEIAESGNLYIYGQLSDWECKPEFKMRFNEESGSGQYKATVLLKQGYYNYRFAFLPDGKPEPLEDKIDGTSYEAENEYLILIYHSAPGSNYDKLVGVRTIRGFY